MDILDFNRYHQFPILEQGSVAMQRFAMKELQGCACEQMNTGRRFYKNQL